MLGHHANLSIGGDIVHDGLISRLDKSHKIKIHGNPDFFDRTYQTFTIDDARELKSLASTKPVKDTGKKIFVLKMDGITVEAQNALLKLLEEPPEYAHFFLVLPSAHLLLPTVKSRLSVLDLDVSGKDVTKGGVREEVESFMKLAPAKRFDYVKKLMDDIAREKKTKQDAIDLLNGLEASIHGKGVRDNKEALETMEIARRYMNDRAPSMKMLLDYVSMGV